jgi:deoxyribodipyrimidine photolyase-related protein
MSYTKLRLILGDQLNPNHSWFKTVDSSVLYVMLEMRQETDYVVHHVQKIQAFFKAMRRFAKNQKAKGHHFFYRTIEDSESCKTLNDQLCDLIKREGIQTFEYQEPDEYRLDKQLKEYANSLSISVSRVNSEHFLTDRYELEEFQKGRKQLKMEYFYRYMRKKHRILLDRDKPVGGKWNYDINNRNKWKGTPAPVAFENKVSKGTQGDSIKIEFRTMGFEGNAFRFPLETCEALEMLDFFVDNLLPYFGTYQDAMHTHQPLLFHSNLSFALNTKMIHPKMVIERAIEAWKEKPGKITLPQVEGFVRQILGWREFMRGIYWMEMPAYKERNFFNHTRALPDFFWTGETNMNCLKTTITDSLKNAYAHHIQRLMITGNFSLLIGANPDEVDAWYLGIYSDAIEWVQLPNTRGMSQFADGGIVATKPYISSGSYINKMSNYCRGCAYSVRERSTENACPFNSLYWNFLEKHRDKLANNRRMSMMYRLLERIPKEEMQSIRERAREIIDQPDAF